MRRALPVLAIAVTATAVVAGSWYAGRTTAPAAADVVTQPAAAAAESTKRKPASTTQAAETRACVLGFGLALDAGLTFDSNTAIEDADELGYLVDLLPVGRFRDAAQELARRIPELVGQPEAESEPDWEGPTDGEMGPSADDPTEEIARLLWELRDECDMRFGQVHDTVTAGAAAAS